VLNFLYFATAFQTLASNEAKPGEAFSNCCVQSLLTALRVPLTLPSHFFSVIQSPLPSLNMHHLAPPTPSP